MELVFLGNAIMDVISGPQEGIKVTLDCVQVALVDSERCVLSLKGGEL